MSIDDRVKYYMGKWYDTKITIERPNQYILKGDHINDTILLLNNHTLLNNDAINKYSKYLVDNAYLLENNHILYTKGDHIHTKVDLPIICKVTNLAHSHIITKLNHSRHWGLIQNVKVNDIAYHLKKDNIVWRGVTTGYSKRGPLVERYHKHPVFNIGFNQICQGAKPIYPIKDTISMKEQLTYKFILSVEGNDVASGLKWQLYSNSVVIMVKPTCVSWAMEDKLVPFVHYIPVKNDYSDLEEKFKWGLNHESECIAISKAAKAFIEQFLNEANEQEIHRCIIKRYIQNVQIE